MRTCIVFVVGILMLGQGTVAGAEFPQGSVGIEVVFTSKEIRVIRAYYESQTGNKRKEKDRHKRKSLPRLMAKMESAAPIR